MAGPPTFSTYNWGAMVRKIEGTDFDLENRHPVVYRFPLGRDKRDSGPDEGSYKGDT